MNKRIIARLILAVLFFAAAHGRARAGEPCVTMTCPSNLVVGCAGINGAIVDYTVEAATTCGQKINILDCVPPSGSLFLPGLTNVTCLALDDLRNSAHCEFQVQVGDMTSPVITSPTGVVARCAGPSGAVVNFAVSAVDECDPAPRLQCVPPSGSLFAIGVTPVTCVAVDASNNQATNIFQVTVEGGCDASCLKFDCPRDFDVSVISGSFRAVSFQLQATNSCSGLPVPVQCQPPSGSVFALGTTPVDCRADDAGMEKRCQFNVVVHDTTPPKLKVPGLLVVPCQGNIDLQGGAQITYPVSATDNVDPLPEITCTPASGSWLPLGTNLISCVARDQSGNAATNTFRVVVELGPKCEAVAVNPELAPDNWSFELGLLGWFPEGSAFAYQPVVGDSMKVERIDQLKQQMDDNIGGGYWQGLGFRLGAKGSHWIGTADNYGVPQGELFDAEQHDETLTGELLSKLFTIQHPYLTFLVGGQNDAAHLRVELLIKTNAAVAGSFQIGSAHYVVEYSATGHGRELMRRQTWSLDNVFHHVLGREARIRIVDTSTTGHLNVDDFRFVDAPPIFEPVVIGDKTYPGSVVLMDGVYYDWDSPVWGFVDMHTHPMSHLGFGEGVMHGQPDGGAADPGNMSVGLSDCNCTHGGYDILHNVCGNYLRQALQIGTDDEGNDSHREGWDSDRINGNDYGRFRHWPVFSTKTHQQMWYEWTKRCYDGGLRVMVALCVNNGLLGSASEGPGPLDDKTVGDNQIQALKDFVARHSDFMEIAYDPYDLRQIVRGNKLAIIIGSELDDIGNLARDPDVHAFPYPGETDVDAYSRQAVTNAVHHLYTNGVRYIFPIHLVNNKFGGTPIAEVMLNVANRYLNGEALQVEPADPSDYIHYWLPTNFDLSVMIADHKDELIAAGAALPAVLPLLPSLLDVFGFTPPGSGGAIGAGLLPVALLGSVGAVAALPGTLQAIPPEVWPINQHYPVYPGKGPGQAPWGHRNARGLTTLGEIAIREMMKRGMMIDADHMSQNTLNEVFKLAESNPVGYPLNSGHNSFRALAGLHSAENHRSGEQMDHIRELGGLFGVGYENCNVASLSEVWLKEPNFSTSKIDNDCGGTSKTVSQIYLYALEAMGGHNVAFGTDVNGLIAGPGPRFGPNSDFGSDNPWPKAERIRNQGNGVLYAPMHGRPIVGPAFIGKGVDPDKVFGFGSEQHLDDNQNLKPGYAYSQEQRDFFPALRIFHFLAAKVEAGWSQSQIQTELQKILEVLDDGYFKPAVEDLVMGLVNGIKGWPPTNNDIEQRLGRLVYQEEVLGSVVPDDVIETPELFDILFSLRAVWYDYHQSFGGNPPLKRCQTGPKDWDINFEGVAHYGMIPDLLQDMTNVGLETTDLDPLFHSAEDFARMWGKSLSAADAINHPRVYIPAQPILLNGVLNIVWLADLGDQLEESDQLGENAVWHPSSELVSVQSGQARVTVRIDPGAQRRFYRVKKH